MFISSGCNFRNRKLVAYTQCTVPHFKNTSELTRDGSIYPFIMPSMYFSGEGNEDIAFDDSDNY